MGKTRSTWSTTRLRRRWLRPCESQCTTGSGPSAAGGAPLPLAAGVSRSHGWWWLQRRNRQSSLHRWPAAHWLDRQRRTGLLGAADRGGQAWQRRPVLVFPVARLGHYLGRPGRHHRNQHHCAGRHPRGRS